MRTVGPDSIKRLLAALSVAVLAAACSSDMQTVPNTTDELLAIDPAETPIVSTQSAEIADLPEPTIQATVELTPVPARDQEIPVEESPEPAAPAEIGVFAEMRDNLATGVAAPDFDARALGDWTFNLSAQRGSFVLVVPTAIGCGDCVFTMSQLAAAYPDYREKNLKLILLNLYPEDLPDSWESYAEAFPELGAIWGVVSSLGFVVDYDILSLGTILLVDPEGKLVFRSNFPLIEQELRQLFELATS